MLCSGTFFTHLSRRNGPARLTCDVIIVTGDAYVDHPSFGMAVIGRVLEAQGFRVGIISQPDWRAKDDFMQLGQPNLFLVWPPVIWTQ